MRRHARTGLSGNQDGHQALHQQITRIESLLEELEQMTAGPGRWPPSLLTQARASIERTRRVLGPSASWPAEDANGDPQPDVDPEVLERMYRDLNLNS
jgi:hypothetical protein